MSDRRKFNNKIIEVFEPYTVEITKSTTYTVPKGATQVTMFLVGGGGGGSGDSQTSNHSGCGGNGGQVVLTSKTVNSGTLDITVGEGGSGGRGGSNKSYAEDGETTIIKYGTSWTVSALGGSAAPSLIQWYNSGGDNSIRPNGQYGGIGAWKNNGEPGVDGVPCDFLNNGKKYGASGGGGSDVFAGYTYMAPGGETGGGTGGGSTNYGGDATFYGAGGGGAAFSNIHPSGGSGYQGIVILKFS